MENYFIFFAYTLAILSIFGLCAFCVELYLNYKENRYHALVQKNVIKLESLIIKGN